MDRVHKPSNSECCMPSSEPYKSSDVLEGLLNFTLNCELYSSVSFLWWAGKPCSHIHVPCCAFVDADSDMGVGMNSVHNYRPSMVGGPSSSDATHREQHTPVIATGPSKQPREPPDFHSLNSFNFKFGVMGPKVNIRYFSSLRASLCIHICLSHMIFRLIRTWMFYLKYVLLTVCFYFKLHDTDIQC
jgi:hypothetical protein